MPLEEEEEEEEASYEKQTKRNEMKPSKSISNSKPKHKPDSCMATSEKASLE